MCSALINTNLIATAAREITGEATALVATPNKDQDASRWDKHPTTFLIHNISKESERTLIERKVWSSSEITFQVAPINIGHPGFPFHHKRLHCYRTRRRLAEHSRDLGRSDHHITHQKTCQLRTNRRRSAGMVRTNGGIPRISHGPTPRHQKPRREHRPALQYLHKQ